jgi:predicted nuclease with TOPRIM domain
MMELSRLVEQVEEENTRLRERIAHLERSQETLRSRLVEIHGGLMLDDDELRALHEILDGLEQDPNHVLLLASLSQTRAAVARLLEHYEEMSTLFATQ